MKILQVNCVETGSTGKIMYDIHQRISDDGAESVICYGRGAKTKRENVYKTCGEMESHINNLLCRLSGVRYGWCHIPTARLIAVIKKEKPDVVHLHCINSYFVNIYKLLDWLKKQNMPTVITLHAEFMYTGGCGHALDCDKWKNVPGCGHCPRWRTETKSFFFDRTASMWKRLQKCYRGMRGNVIFASVSPWVMERAKVSPMLCDKEHRLVLNGTDTEHIFHPCDAARAEKLRQELGIRDEKIIFHATPDFSENPEHIKGGHFVIALAKRMPDARFVIAGKYDEKICVPDNVLLLGRVDDQKKLAELYSVADITLLTSKKETFSMVTAESLCCGTPVVGFRAGAPEMIALPDYSMFVENGNIEALQKAAEEMLDRSIDKNDVFEKAAVYAKQLMVQKYMDVYQALHSANLGG